jgi:hypothetical protein
MLTDASRLSLAALAPLALAASLAACGSSHSVSTTTTVITETNTSNDGADSGVDSGSPNTQPSGPASVPSSAAFAGFCTGTTLRPTVQLTPLRPGTWSGSSAKFPAGTTFLLAIEQVRRTCEGYTYQGTAVSKLESIDGSELVLGTDFSSNCVSTPSNANTTFTVLRDSKFYADRNLTGTTCTIPAGTTFNDYGIETGTPTYLRADKLNTACGFSPGYSSDLLYAFVVVR